MRLHRRIVLKSLLALGAVISYPRSLLAARPDAAFELDDHAAAIADVFGQTVTDSDQVAMKIPDIAENGAVVPVTVSTDLPDVQSISIVVDRNPTPFAASFNLTPRSLPVVSVRIKMGESSRVQALVMSAGKLYGTSKEVKVTIGGCGG
jgi:sulfur-oxidizing protein SoxY